MAEGGLPAPVARYVDDSPLIRAGQAGMWPAEAEPLDGPALAFSVGSVPLPAGATPAPTLSSGLVMSRGTTQPAAAWRWLAFLSRQPVPARGATPLNNVPARADLLANDADWLQRDPRLQAALREALARPAQVQAALATALHAVVADAQPVREALQAAQSELAAAGSAAPETDATAPSPLLVASPPPVAGSATVKITFEASFSNRPDLFPPLIEQFNTAQDAVQVTLQDSTAPAFMLQDLAARSDCFASFAPLPHDDVQAVRDLQPLLDAASAVPRTDFLPHALAPVQRDGRLLGLPLAARMLTLGYNTALFDAQGLPYPNVDWTWDDLVQTVDQLTQGAGLDQTYGFAYRTGESHAVAYVLDQFGAAPTQSQEAMRQPNFTDPTVVAALRSFVDLVGTTAPFPRTTDHWQPKQWSQLDQLIFSDQVGMWLDVGDVHASSERVGQARTETMAITLPPLGTSAPSIWGSQLISFYISAQTPAPAAC